jgi:hypothetical protein
VSSNKEEIMRTHPVVVAVFTALSLLWTINVAYTSNVPDYSFALESGVYLGGTKTPLSTFGTVAATDEHGSVNLTTQGTPFPYLMGSVSVSGGYYPVRAWGLMYYSFQIVGPAGAVDVLLNANGGMSQNAIGATGNSSQGDATSRWDLYLGSTLLNGNGIYKSFVTESSSFTDAKTFTDSIPLSLSTNQTYTVRMEVMANALTYEYTSSATAWLDPYFQLAPSVTNPGAYSFELSSGIGNSPAPVPVPGAVWLFGSGLAGLFGLKRKHLG